MEALILAAGLGTRLRPLTNDRPKAMVEINGMSLFNITESRLAFAGIKHCVVNIHHFAKEFKEFITNNSTLNQCDISISDESNLLLDTGGAIKHAAKHFSGREPVVIHNVDILSDIDFTALEKHHLASGNLITLCTSLRETKRMLLFDSTGNLAGIYGRDDAPGLTPLPFSGISIVSPELFDLMPSDDHPYSVFSAYLQIAKTHRIGYFMHNGSNWFDVGTLDDLQRARNLFTPEALQSYIRYGEWPN